jgi:hypothetical protein
MLFLCKKAVAIITHPEYCGYRFSFIVNSSDEA